MGFYSRFYRSRSDSLRLEFSVRTLLPHRLRKRMLFRGLWLRWLLLRRWRLLRRLLRHVVLLTDELQLRWVGLLRIELLQLRTSKLWWLLQRWLVWRLLLGRIVWRLRDEFRVRELQPCVLDLRISLWRVALRDRWLRNGLWDR